MIIIRGIMSRAPGHSIQSHSQGRRVMRLHQRINLNLKVKFRRMLRNQGRSHNSRGG